MEPCSYLTSNTFSLISYKDFERRRWVASPPVAGDKKTPLTRADTANQLDNNTPNDSNDSQLSTLWDGRER